MVLGSKRSYSIFSDGSLVAVGVHFRPHGTKVGGSNAKSLKSASQENDESGKMPLGGHMCMYFGDSRNDLQKKANPEFKYNAAAHNAKKKSRYYSRSGNSIAYSFWYRKCEDQYNKAIQCNN